MEKSPWERLWEMFNENGHWKITHEGEMAFLRKKVLDVKDDEYEVCPLTALFIKETGKRAFSKIVEVDESSKYVSNGSYPKLGRALGFTDEEAYFIANVADGLWYKGAQNV